MKKADRDGALRYAIDRLDTSDRMIKGMHERNLALAYTELVAENEMLIKHIREHAPGTLITHKGDAK